MREPRGMDPVPAAARLAAILVAQQDLGILRLLLASRAAQGGTIVMEDGKAETDAILRRYYDAILHNAHFIALSANVEEFLSVTDTLAHLFPADAPRYEVMAAGADRQANSLAR